MRSPRPSPFELVPALLLAAFGARAGDVIDAEVTAAGADDCGGTITLSWSGQLRRALDGSESFSTLTVPRPVAAMTPSDCGECARTEYDASGASIFATFARQPDGEVEFGFTLDGIRARRQMKEGEACIAIEDSHSLAAGTFDEPPFRLTSEELAAGFERSFAIRGDGFPGYEGAVQVALRKGPGEPRVIVGGPHCACGAEATVEVTARALSGDVVFERFEAKGAPAGSVRRNDGGREAHLVLANAATAGGPVEAVAVYRDRGKRRRAPAHVVHLALVEKPTTRDNERWGGRGGADFAFDDGQPGHLELDAEGRAWLDGRDVARSLRWEADAGYLRPEPASGARTKFRADGLPRRNSELGPKKLRAALEDPDCPCESEPREIRIFFTRDASNNPGRERPNWAYYWAQTRAGQLIPFEIGKSTCGRDLGRTGGQYDYCTDKIYLPADKPTVPCRHHPRGATKNVGIDCFAQTLRHEGHHQQELKRWWRGKPVEPVSLDDPDGDLMPSWIEKEYGCRELPLGGVPVTAADLWEQLEGMSQGQLPRSTQYSCPVGAGPGTRPWDDVIDSEVNAFWVGWTWPTGSADDEDWGWPGKNWPE